MGIRQTQIYGLTEEANSFLKENCRIETSRLCPHCDEPIDFKLMSKDYEDMSSIGMYDDGPILKEYYLKDDRKAREVIQATP